MLSEPLEHILERESLLNPRSLGVVSRTLARAVTTKRACATWHCPMK
ncbi:MAG: hypothetical protein ACOYU7_02200 [Bacillota bacterium]